jgi:hypothetical protein
MSEAMRLSEIFRTINGPEGRARLQKYLESRPLPRYWAHPDLPQAMILEDKDGTRTVGRFIGRSFVPLDVESDSEIG